jgi:tRNA threonylcarbamoyl adenosine modification protein YeaZ
MRTLVIDSATDACSVALFDGDTLLAGEYRLLGRGHAEALVPMIAALPDKGRANRIVVSLGPGSFTGVRVGLAAAKALALAWGSDLLGYPTLALIAAQARDQRAAQPVSVCMTGGHGEWFVQDFDTDGLPSSALASLTPAAATNTAACPLVAGSRAEALVAARASGEGLALLPDARCLALLPAALLSIDVSPLYGRPPDAKLPEKRS